MIASEARPKIVLHIGQGKTGTSALQSALARNHELLKSAGVLYPEHASAEQARAGHVMSGNLDPENWFEGQVIPIVAAAPGYASYIFSSEHLFRRMDTFFAAEGRYRDLYDFEILMAVRSPIEMLPSVYQQAVKRGGFHEDIAAFAEHETSTRIAADLVAAMERQGIAFTLFNYSVIRDAIVPRILDHIGVRTVVEGGEAATVGRVNRSLTLAELAFVRFVNQIFGADYGRLIADALVNELPDIDGQLPPLDEELRRDVIARNRAAVDRLNACLPHAEQIDLDAEQVPPPPPADATLSAEQAALIRRIFPSALTPADGVILRDIAMTHEQAAPLSRDQAIHLMEYAQKARPHGQIIAGKLAEWRAARDAEAGRTKD
ncbi:MAG: hypothetical protein KAY22_03400 [Rhizorhabdus sp.]|uniref:hypothetical protein n=1 Tax=Rhizorhabdus sp. TaxID=1968843 RepID=UPI001B50518B|nr:hypothetical protein [Rhizorhabdus sp.]MBP8231328.1 hypothetical protein [Rhizorhabdus sp.]